MALALRTLLLKSSPECNVFLTADSRQMKAGENWLDRIESELREAKVVIVLLSHRSLARPWINFEAGAAWINGALLIPACAGGLTAKDLPKPYADLQAVCLDNDQQLYQLVRTTADALKVGLPAPPRDLFGDEYNELRSALAELGKEAPFGASEVPISARGLQRSDEVTISGLSELARKFLTLAAATSTGEIHRYDFDQALVITIGDESFEARLDNGRFREEMEDTIVELEESELIADVVGGIREFFQLTTKGYRIADRLKTA